MTLGPATVDAWLQDLGLDPVERAEREGVVSWDLLLDGRRRHDIRATLILDPTVALVCWVHYAPPITDAFRVSYRKLLRWNDELPFVKFAIAPDERPVLTSELSLAGLDVDALGAALARLVAVCDLLVADSTGWLWPGTKVPPTPVRAGRTAGLLDRYASVVAEVEAAAHLAPDPTEGVAALANPASSVHPGSPPR
jgi:hypothetical protein